MFSLTSEQLHLLFVWVPSAFFVLMVLYGVLWGLIRGLRKSAILWIHGIIAFFICLIAYIILVNIKSFDVMILKIANKFLGEGGLQGLIGVSAECGDLSEIIVAKLEGSTNEMVMTLLKENMNYVYTLASLVYHIVVAVLLYFVYLILLVILYIIYNIFYSQRKYRRYITKLYEEDDENVPYNKRPWYGALVNGLRYAVKAIVSLSFIGTLLFIAGGGIGNNKYDKYPDVKFEDDNISFGYEVYKNIGSYGTNGIFAVLNVLKTTDDVPFYLFAADLVLQGGLVEEDKDISTNVKLREEIGAYTVFATDTLNLLLQYGGQDMADIIEGVIKGTVTTNEAMEFVLDIFGSEAFQEDYSDVIEDFDAKTYFINLSLSLVDSIVDHIDEFGLVNESIAGIMKAIFVGENKLPLSRLLDGNDAKEILKLALSLTNDARTYDFENATFFDFATDYGLDLLARMDSLSIFTSKDRKPLVNNSLIALYDYFMVKLNEAGGGATMALSSVSDAAMVSNKNLDDVDWINELRVLLKVIPSGIDLYQQLQKTNDTMGFAGSMFYLFNPENPDLEKNEEIYDEFLGIIGNSMIAEVVISSSFVFETLADALGSTLSSKYPPSIRFANYIQNGTAYEGEIYHLLTSIKVLSENGMTETYNKISADSNTIRCLEIILELLNRETKNGGKVLDYVLDSEMIAYMLTGTVTNSEFDEDINVIIPKTSLDIVEETENGQTVTYSKIKKSEFSQIIDKMPLLLEILASYKDDDSSNNNIDFVKFIEYKEEILPVDTLHATIINVMIPLMCSESDDFIHIPDNYQSSSKPARLYDFHKNIWYTTSEVSKMLNAMDLLFDITGKGKFNVKNIDEDEVIDGFYACTVELESDSKFKTEELIYPIDVYYLSATMRATLSLMLDGLFGPMVEDPKLLDSCKTNNAYSKEEVVAVRIAMDELSISSIEMKRGIDDDRFDPEVFNLRLPALMDSARTRLDILYDSELMASVLSTTFDESLGKSTSKQFRTAIKKRGYYEKSEILALLRVLDESGITNEKLLNKAGTMILNSMMMLNEASIVEPTITKLELFYKSDVIKNMFAEQLDYIFNNNDVNKRVMELSKEIHIPGTQIKYYKQNEVSKLIEIMSNVLGIDNVSRVSSVDYSRKIVTFNEMYDEERTKLDLLYESLIMVNILTNKMSTLMKSSNTLQYDPDALEYIPSADTSLMKKAEVKSLVSFVNHTTPNATSLASLSISTIDEESKGYIIESNLLKATTTKQLMNGGFTIPVEAINKDSYKYNVYKLTDNEMDKVLVFIIDDLGGNTSTTSIPLTESSINHIVDSKVLSATVSKKILSSSSLGTISEDKIEKTEDPRGRAVSVINSDELKNTLNSFVAMGMTSLI